MTSTTAEFLKTEKKQAGHLLSWSVALGTLGGIFLVVQAWLLATVINAVIFKAQNLNEVMPYLWGMLLVLAGRSILVYFSEQTAFSAAAIIKQSIRQRLYRKINQQGPAYLTGERSGELATVITDGVEALEAYYAKYLPAMSLAALIPLAILVFIIPMDWRSAIVFLVTAPLIPFFMILIGKGTEKINQKQWKQLQRMGGHFLDVIQGLTTIKLFNASQREGQVIARISEEYRITTMKVLRIAFISALALEFLTTVSIAMVAVLIGFRLLFGEMDFFSGFFVLLLAPEFYLPLRSLGVHYHSRMNAVAAAEKILLMLEGPLLETGHIKNQDRPVTTPVSIRFEHIDFAYKADVPVLTDFNLSIHDGETIAIVGPSGAGKTTLANLLLGFVQADKGQILINDVDLKQINLDHWYQQVSWVSQRPRVFHGTVADNISLGLLKVSIDAIEKAANQANALEFIEALPEGFDTIIGEGGRILSVGQVQRLVLARAFLRDSPVILLDEATANLDAENEHLIQDAIKKLSKHRTMLLIAHRLSTVRHADRIIVMENGRMAESGTHDELLETDGLYLQLVTAHTTTP